MLKSKHVKKAKLGKLKPRVNKKRKRKASTKKGKKKADLTHS